jgi:hypothetical protein
VVGIFDIKSFHDEGQENVTILNVFQIDFVFSFILLSRYDKCLVSNLLDHQVLFFVHEGQDILNFLLKWKLLLGRVGCFWFVLELKFLLGERFLLLLCKNFLQIIDFILECLLGIGREAEENIGEVVSELPVEFELGVEMMLQLSFVSF